MRPLPRKISLLAAGAGVVLLALGAASPVRAQVHPAEISEEQSTEAPYRDSGRLTVYQGNAGYLGTATYIRRYTGLTAGHMLYNGRTGLSTSVTFQQAFYEYSSSKIYAGFIAVLSGYQAAAQDDNTSDAAFERDMGYLVFTHPARNNEWALWSADPLALSQGTAFDVLGYAAESFRGDILAQVHIDKPYQLLRAPGLYESTAYYAQEGMSGGPVYASYNGTVRLAAVTVGGTSPPEPAQAGVRAITPEETSLFLEAEYVHGMIIRGFIKGTPTVAPGGSVVLKTGVVFADYNKENGSFSSRYDDLKLVAVGAYKKKVKITKLSPSKSQATFSADIPSGQPVSFELFRTAVPRGAQTKLAAYTVTVQ